jgi:hypothetical protein
MASWAVWLARVLLAVTGMYCYARSQVSRWGINLSEKMD